MGQDEDGFVTIEEYNARLDARLHQLVRAIREQDAAAICSHCRAGAPVERGEHGVWWHPCGWACHASRIWELLEPALEEYEPSSQSAEAAEAFERCMRT